MTETDIARVDQVLHELAMYRWDGVSAIALVGSPLAIPSAGIRRMTALSSTSVLIVENDGDFRVYRWTEGTTSWALEGSVTSGIGGSLGGVTALSETEVITTDIADNKYAFFRNTAGTWAKVGTNVTLPVVTTSGRGNLAAISSTDAVVTQADSTEALSGAYIIRWDNDAEELVALDFFENIQGAYYASNGDRGGLYVAAHRWDRVSILKSPESADGEVTMYDIAWSFGGGPFLHPHKEYT